MTGRLPVIAAPMLDPGHNRIEMTLPAGLTVAEIVAAALPGAAELVLARARVVLSTPRGQALVERANWSRVRPRAGVAVVIRIVPGKDALKSVLSIVVSIAAIALGQFWLGPMIASGLDLTGKAALFANAAATAGLQIVGSLLINALFPPPGQPDKEKPTYAIAGWQNQLAPDAPVPAVLGYHRFAPPFAARSWTEVVGDVLYLRCLFNFGYGPVEISDVKIGDTPIDNYDELEIDWRYGQADDEPVTLYPSQVIEHQHNAELLRDLPRDDYGEIIKGEPAEDQPVSRFTAADAAEAAVIIAFPGGLAKFDKNGKQKAATVDIRIRARQVGAATWADVTTMSIRASRTEAVYRAYRWVLPSRGRYEVELTRMTAESTKASTQDRCSWLALQSFRPEYPIAFGKPLALAAVRVKATHQLNGQLDSFNAVVKRVCKDWDAGTETWIERATQNPASLFRWILQGPANPFPAADAEVDLAWLADWHEFCAAKGLAYNRIHDFAGSIADQLAAVAAAGRASPRHDGTKWGGVIDRPTDIVVDHVNSRNSRQFKLTRTYFEPPHAMRVSFLDEENDFQSAERVVRWPGYEGDVTVTEQFDVPGVTNATQVFLATRRRQYELIYRPDTITAIQDGAVRVATRGDQVMGVWDTLQSAQRAAAVVAVRGNLVELDQPVTMEAGKSYACRFLQVSDDGAGMAMTTSVVRQVLTWPGENRSIMLAGPGALPDVRAVLTFGEAASESMALRVRAVEGGDDFSTVLHMLAAAPEIDELLDADEVPAWSGRVGAEIEIPDAAPPAPVVTGVQSHQGDDGEPDGVTVLLRPANGSAVVVGNWILEHRLVGAPTWTAATGPAGDGGVTVTGYTRGQNVQLQALAQSTGGAIGAGTALLIFVVGSDLAALPTALTAVSVTAGLGGALLKFTPGANTATVQVFSQAGTGGTLDPDADLVQEVGAADKQPAEFAHGDVTRVALVSWTFDTAAGVTFGTNWSHDAANKRAQKVAGAATVYVSQAAAFVAAKDYRVVFDAIGGSSGNLFPRFTGSAAHNGTTRTGTGTFAETMTAAAGETTFAIGGTAACDRAIDNVTVYELTADCLPNGARTWWLRPINDDGQPGPLTGPLTATIT
jgi:hypothetical protein